MIFAACPPVYTLPGTWSDPEKIARCNDTLIPHGNIDPQYGILVFFGVVFVSLIAYAIYLTFGSGKKNLKDQIDEHSKMHELGIAHGHKGKKHFITTNEKHNPRHKHE